MTITKRHYEILAKAICETLTTNLHANPSLAAVYTDATRDVAEKIASVLQSDNPRFHRSRFLDACGFKIDYTDPPATSWQGGNPALSGRRLRKRRAYTPQGTVA